MNQHSQAGYGSHRLALAVVGSICFASIAIGVASENVRQVRQLGEDTANGISQMNTPDETTANTADWASTGRSNQRPPVDIANSAASSTAGASSFVDNLMGHQQQGSGAAAESVAVSSSSTNSGGGHSMWPFGGHQQQQQQQQQQPQQQHPQHGGWGNFGGFGQQQQLQQQHPHGHKEGEKGPPGHKGFNMDDMNRYLHNPMELVNAISHQFGISREKIVEQLGGRFSFNMDTMLNPMVATIKVIEKTFVPDACRLKFFCQVGQRFSPHLRQHLGRISPQTLGGSAHVKALSQGISGSDCNLAFETCEPKLKKQFEVMQGNQQGGHQGGGHDGGYEEQSGGGLGGGAHSGGNY